MLHPKRLEPARVRHLVLADARLPDLPTLLHRLPSDVEVRLVHAHTDALSQIAQAAGRHSELSGLHVLGHGTAGRMLLGDQWLDARALEQAPAAMAIVATALADDAHVWLYGCRNAQGSAGARWLDAWAWATGAAVHGTDEVWPTRSLALGVTHTPGATPNPLHDAWQDSGWTHHLAPANTHPTFNSGAGTGMALLPGGTNSGGGGLVQQADGKLVAAATQSIGGSPGFKLVRLLTDGQIDDGFGISGVVGTKVGLGADFARSILVQSDGRLVVAGYSGNQTDFSVARFLADGTLDASFGDGGKRVLPVGPNSDEAYTVLQQPNGQLLVGGFSYLGGSDSDFSVVRLNVDGSLDEGFGNGGRALIAVGGDYDTGRTMALLPNGQLVMAGQTSLDVSLIRLNTDGTPDNTFGTNGRSIVRLPDTADSPASVLVQADGGLLVAFNASSSVSRFGVMRLTDSGILDTSFASGGVLIDPALGHAINTSAILQTDGKLVVAGQLVGVNESFDIFLVRLNADGSRDAGFGTDGRVILSIRPEATAPGMGATNYSDRPFQVIQQADGKLAVVGRNDGGELSIFRLNPDGSRDTTFGGFAVTTLNAEVAYTEGVAPVALDSTVRIVDAQLAALNGGNGDYSGASLTLARLGGSNAEDVLGISTSGASFTVSGNALQSAGQTFATFSQSDGSLSIRFTGSGTVPTQALVNEVLSHITYANSSSTPPATVSLAWTFSDGNTGAQGTGGTLGTMGVTTVNITAVDNNVAPTLVGLPDTAQAVRAGTPAALANFTVYDADRDSLTVFLTPTNGTLGNLNDIDPVAAGVQLFGSAASINAAIAGATFTASSAGAARIDILVSDGVAASPTTGTYTLTAAAANVAPTIAGLPDAAQNVIIGTPAALADFTLADANDDTLTVTLTPTNGTLGNLTDADPGTAGLQLTGSAESINTAIAGATFNAVAEGAARIDILVSDGIAASPTAGTYTLTAAGTPGNTHPSFNAGLGTGTVITAVSPRVDNAYSVIQQADGKLIMAGRSEVGGDGVLCLVRLNADGSLDTSFDADGTLLLPASMGIFLANSVIEQANGQLVAAGEARNVAETGFAVVRINRDGSLDTDFGAGGVVFNTLGVGYSRANSVIQQADGALVIAGGSTSDFGIVRLNTNGSPDLSFGSGGALRVSIGFSDQARSVLQQTDDKLVIAGSSGGDFSVIRLNANGTLDNSFSGDGKHVISVGNGNDGAYSVIQQQDGKLVLAGITNFGYDFGLVRLNTDGTPDEGFGTNGTLAVPLGANSIDQAYSLIQQADGKLVVCGRSTNSPDNYDFSIVRLNLDGTLDTTFSADGKLLIPVGRGDDSAASVIQQADGKLVLAGAAGGSVWPDFGIVRLNPDGSLDTTFGGAARTTLGGEAAYTEGAAPVVLDGSVQIVDAQLAALNGGNGDYSGASLTLARQDGAKSEDKLDISASGASFSISGTTLQSGGQTFATFSVGDGSLSIRFTGSGAAPTQALVNDVLSHITYANGSRTPPASVTLAWTFNDGNSGAQGPGGALSADGITTVTITPVDDNRAPTIGGLSGTAQAVRAGTPAALADFTVADADGDRLTVTLTPTNGTLGNLSDANPGLAGVQLVGSAAAVNAAIAGATFAAGAAGAARIDIRVSDGIAASPTQGAYTLTAAAANVAPTLAGVPGTAQGVTVGTPAALADFTVADVNGDPLTVTLIPSNGTLGNLTDADPGVAGIQLAGSAASINAAISGATFVARQAGAASIAISASDGVAATPTTGTYSLTAIPPAPANSAPTFVPGAGKVLVNMGVSGHAAYSVIQQDDGKLVLTGVNFGVARLNANGSLDTTFSGDGKFVAPFLGNAFAYSVIQQADGKLVAAGGSDGDFGLIRLDADGSLDPTFDADGVLTVPVGSSADAGYSVIQQADGKLVLAGFSFVDNDRGDDFSLIRLNPNGSLDSSFGIGGKLLMPIGSSSDFAFSVIQQADGKLVVAGSLYGSNPYFGILRLNADGSADASFGIDGKLIVPVGSDGDYARSVIQQTDGKLVVAGGSNTVNGIAGFSVIRLNVDGSLDTTFSTDGKLIVPLGSSDSFAASVIQQIDGKLVLAGYARSADTGGRYDFSLIRLNADGSLDATFSDDGILLMAVGTLDDQAFSVIQQTDGKLVVAGISFDSPSSFSLIRLNSDGSLDTTFDGLAASSLNGTVGYTEGTSAIRLDSSVQIVDSQLGALDNGAGNYSGASLTLARQGGANAQDVLGISTLGATFTLSGNALQSGGRTFATFTQSIGNLSLNFTGSGTAPTQALVDDVLSHITYANSSSTPPARVTLEWTFSDGNSGAQGTGGALSATGITTVTITPVDDNRAPTIGGLSGTAQAVRAGTPAALADFTVADADGDRLTVTLTPTNGTLGNLSDANPGLAGVQLVGSAAAINAAISGAMFTAGVAGAARIDIRVSDGIAAAPTQGAYTLTAAVDNVAPTLAGVPGTAQRVTVGTPAALADFTVADADGDPLYLFLAPENGTLGNLIDADPGVAGVQLVGSAASINAAIAGATFTAGAAGAARIYITVDDGSLGTPLYSYAFTAVAANVPPTITGIPGTPQRVTVGTPAALADFTVVDPDSDSLTVFLTPINGTLGNIVDTDPGVAGIQLVGSVASINAAIAGATFTASAAGAARIEVAVADYATGTTFGNSYTFTAVAANVPPTVTGIPGTPQRVTVGTPAALADFTVVDPDSDSLTVFLTPINGTLGNIVDTDPGVAGIQLVGSVASINAAIAGATFTASAAGAARIEVAVADYATGTTFGNSYTFTAVATNVSPIVTGIPGTAQSVTVGTPAALADFTVDDANGDPLTVTLAPINGTLGNLVDADPGVSGVQLAGSAASINAAIAGATFTAGAAGAARIDIVVNDGSSGTGVGSYAFTAAVANVPPSIAGIPGTPQSVTVGIPAALANFTVADTNGNPFTVTLTPTNGVLVPTLGTPGALADMDPIAPGIQLTGTAASINSALAGATFMARREGPARIDILVSSEGFYDTLATATYSLLASPLSSRANTAPLFATSTGSGKVIQGTASSSIGSEVIQLSDGTLVLAGYASSGLGSAFSVVRLNADGSFDTPFREGSSLAQAGISYRNEQFHDVIQQTVIQQTDGKLVIAGAAGNTDVDVALIRFNADGTIDTSFDVDGSVDGRRLVQVGSGFDTASGLIQQADGKLVVAGYSIVDGNADFSLIRLNIDGALDETFSGDGTLRLSVGQGDDYGHAVIQQADGKLVVAGQSRDANDAEGPSRFSLVRVLENGIPDPEFGDDGTVLVSVGTDIDVAHSVIQQTDGKLVIAGSSVNGTETDFSLIRLNADGSLDATFGGDGKVLIPVGTRFDEAYSVIQQADGKLLAAGSSSNGTGRDFSLVRLLITGELDPDFGENGRLVLPVGPGNDAAYSVIQQADGKLVVAGSSEPSGSGAGFSLVRLNLDGSLDATFGPQTVTPTLGGTVSYTAGAAAIRLDSSAAIVDAQLAALGGGNGDYSGAVLTLTRQGGGRDDDVLGISTRGASFTVSGDALQSGGQTFATFFNHMRGFLSIEFTGSGTVPTQALVNDVLSHITYANISDTPPDTVAIAWTFYDGNSGSQGTGGALSATGISMVAITSTDGRTPSRVDVLPTAETENTVPGIGIAGVAALEGDGNGDGIWDSFQAAVASVQFGLRESVSPDLPSGTSAFVTLVAGSRDGMATQSDARLTNVQQIDAPADMPKAINAPLGLISFDAAIARAGGRETFSLFADVALGVNGYWKQDARGTWVNLASEPYGGKMTEVGGKLRLDFVIEDGGQFDADGTANGVIVDPGALGTLAQSITDHPSVVPVAEQFWF